MTQEFCDYNQSFALKELGFDEPCFGWYSQSKNKVTPHIPCSHNTDYNTVTRPWTTDKFECCSAPLKQQAFKFFRNKYNFYSIIVSSYADNKEVKDRFFFEIAFNKKLKQELEYHTTYEEAENACLDELIEMAKNK